MKATIYGIAGTGTFSSASGVAEIARGSILEVEAGSYELAAGADGLEIVLVWNLRPFMN